VSVVSTRVGKYSCHVNNYQLSILLIFVEEMEMGKIIIKVLTNKLMFPYQRNTTIREVRIYD
jgi:hypothetical protein